MGDQGKNGRVGSRDGICKIWDMGDLGINGWVGGLTELCRDLDWFGLVKDDLWFIVRKDDQSHVTGRMVNG